MKQFALLIASTMIAITLAGCTSNSEGPASQAVDAAEIDSSSISLGNQGAIEGLVVDDNYRPVQLKQDWGSSQPGDYQDLGFVLIVETGKRYETTENGEFNVFPLEPGTYTLRVAADAHEAKDTKVNVVKGEWSEATLEARRQYSGGGTLLSQEYVIFVNCAVSTVAVSMVQGYGCGDLSGDSGRYGFGSDYTAIASDIRGMVTEVYVHQDGYHDNTIRWDGCPHAASNNINGCAYGEMDVYNEARWGKSVLYPGLQVIEIDSECRTNFQKSCTYLQEGQDGWCHPLDDQPAEACDANDAFGRFFAFTLEAPFNTFLFPMHANKYYSDQATDPAQPTTCSHDTYEVRRYGCDSRGNGVIMGTKAQYLQNVFLYELPDEGIENFCQLCDDAAVPE